VKGSPAYSAHGVQEKMDRMFNHGLEALGLYYGVYRAQVIDNADDGNMGRIKVRCPSVGDTEKTKPRLAYPMQPLAGAQHGFKTIPPTDSYVYVVFENGKLDLPIWTGGWWRKGDMHPDLESTEAFGLVTPGGHKLVFLDTEDSASITLTHINGSKVEIDVDGNVTVQSSSAAEIKLDSEGNVTITNASGKIVTVGAGDNESGFLGDVGIDLIGQICDAIQQITVPTAVGPSGPPVNAALFANIKSQLSTALSKTVLVAK